MNKAKKILSLLLVTSFVSIANFKYAQAADQIPDGWYKAGNAPAEYEVGIDKEKYNSKKVSYLSSDKSEPSGFVTLMQSVKADKYLGKRLRLSAYVKTENIEGSAQLWMRIDGQKANEMLGFDNMGNRMIKGSTGWKKYNVVLDVPQASKRVAFGVISNGKGKTLISDIKFEVVNKNVKTTSSDTNESDKPKNLDLK